MNIQLQIEAKIIDSLNPQHLLVINESANHNVPPGSESHFKVVIVSEIFEGKKLLERQKLVNEILASELKNQIHALTMQTNTPNEWMQKGGMIPDSPPCLGGSKSS